MVNVNCDYCKGEIKRPPSLLKGKKHFCNYSCMGKWRSKNVKGSNHHQYNRVKVNCEFCGEGIKRIPFRLKLNKHQFCDDKCRGKYISKHNTGENHPNWKGGKHTLICEYCGDKYKAKSSKIERSRFCKKQCLYDWMHENLTGKNSYNWKGGLSFEPYGIKFDNELKELIRERDNYICQECGYTQEQLGYKLSVHHIDYDKQNNSPDNLISLCKSCHIQTNYSRKDWTKYFQNIKIKGVD